MPTREEYEANAEKIRKTLLNKFASREHLLKMSYKAKRAVLYTLFSAPGSGVAIHKRDKDKSKFLHFSIVNEFLDESELINKDGMFYGDYLRKKSLQKRKKRSKTGKKYVSLKNRKRVKL
jgi:hypothetical protein